MLSAAGWAVLFTILALAGLGSLIWAIAPDADYALIARLSQSMLLAHASDLQPKPRERYVYIGLTLLLPLVIAVALWLAAKLRLPGQRQPLDWLLIAAALAGGAWVLDQSILSPPFRPQLAWGWLGLLAVAILIIDYLASRAKAVSAHRIVRAVLIAAAVICTFGWFVYNLDGIGKSGGHFDAVFASILAIHNGATCLVSAVSQYGCYGEIYNLVMAVFGFSLVHMTLLSALLQAVALSSVMVFAARQIGNPLLLLACGLCLIIAANRIVLGILDNYLQYMPLRFVFPAVSLLVVLGLQRSRRYRACLLAGLFGGLAIFFNLDTGVPVTIAMGGFILLDRSTSRLASTMLKPKLLRLGIYGLGVVLALALLTLWLFLKSGQWPDPELALHYQKLFYITGFFMLPMPHPPAEWCVALAPLIVTLVLFGRRIDGGNFDPLYERAAYLAILGIGLFSYYSGRSHVLVLLLCCWPSIILLFCLLDRLPARAVLGRAAGAFILICAISGLVAAWPFISTFPVERWSEVLGYRSGPASADAAFITSQTTPRERVGILSPDESALLAATDTVSAFTGPGIAELLLKEDAARRVEVLKDKGPRDLFIEHRLLFLEEMLLGTAPWIAQAMPDIEAHYALKNWDAPGRILHMVNKDTPFSGADLFQWKPATLCLHNPACTEPDFFAITDPASGALQGRWQRPILWPLKIAAKGPKGEFRLELDFIAAAQQVPYASLFSSEAAGYEGLVIQYRPGTDSQYALMIGDGKKWIQGPVFHVPTGLETKLMLNYQDNRFTIAIDGKTVASFDPPPFMPGSDGFNIGDWANNTRKFSGTITRIKYFDHRQADDDLPLR
jgi:hypothetical protein